MAYGGIRFEMLVDGEGAECQISIYLDPEAEKNPITIVIVPVEPVAKEDLWETVIDFDRAKIIQLRAALTAMLEIMPS